MEREIIKKLLHGSKTSRERWLIGALSHGSRRYAELVLEAERRGISKSAVRRLGAKLGVEIDTRGFGVDKESWWRMR